MANKLHQKKQKLYVSNIFVRGLTRAFDLSAEKCWPDISNSDTKDYIALRSDWESVGNTIREESRRYQDEYARKRARA